MDDWKALIDQAMQIETTDTIGAHGLYEHAVRAALAQSQMLLGDLEAAQIIESIYGALVAYSQTVMLRMSGEVGGPDHAFRAGQAYSCVLNHLIDRLTVAGITVALGALDDFSDTLHEEIIVQAAAVVGPMRRAIFSSISPLYQPRSSPCSFCIVIEFIFRKIHA